MDLLTSTKSGGKNFDCSRNQLTSLMGAPQTGGGYFDCSRNQLTTLEGAPQTVKEKFSCGGNKLGSLVGAPQTVGGHFTCYGNQLTSLEGAPQKVSGVFECERNNLSLAEIAHFKALREGSIRIGYCDYTDEEIDKAVKIIKLHEHLNQTIKQKDNLPMARAVSNVQVSATRTGKLKI
ncbi:hypothetical protein [Burkholderia cenocepacia]|uniref:Uncharacterized protein n=1 Tax=Burkholderia cenocepacia TaxID=95486 RepID=A0ABD4UDM1_9BURK|nr:hypothetical protein [Burkholderia cenocepacia]MCW3696339.1 hypothetical protein [Burkholderia cenocepacia]MCW3704442.1 hypothetical protein [Burkholderia cenocepacia]MCW3712119.1 hypothetical protein [Burkholderia cenocepacia]MCW3720118.1 hypothetical protein [Burkholderia cenocepacia]MCW3727818.1 hypothetical protein [Burkholderia cenocepacia]